MKLRFEVDQADAFRRGIDRPKSIVSIDVNPADVPEDQRNLIADRLVGIDVLELFYYDGEILKGFRIRELQLGKLEPKRIVARGASLEALIQAIKVNEHFITAVQRSFNQPVQFQLLESAPKNEQEFRYISDQNPKWIEETLENIKLGHRITFDCFLEDIQTSLSAALNARSYRVSLLPIPGSTAQGRFFCERVFSGLWSGKPISANSPIIVYNERTGRKVETSNLFQALDFYLISGTKPGTMLDDLSILRWENQRWISFAPEGLIELANGAKAAPVSASEE